MRLGIRSALPFALPTAGTVRDGVLVALRWAGIATAVIVTTGAVAAVSFAAVVLNLS